MRLVAISLAALALCLGCKPTPTQEMKVATPLGEVCMFLDGPDSDPFCGMLKINGGVGNDMDADLTCCRLPTYEEVLRFVNVNLRRIESLLVIV